MVLDKQGCRHYGFKLSDTAIGSGDTDKTAFCREGEALFNDRKESIQELLNQLNDATLQQTRFSSSLRVDGLRSRLQELLPHGYHLDFGTHSHQYAITHIVFGTVMY